MSIVTLPGSMASYGIDVKEICYMKVLNKSETFGVIFTFHLVKVH